MFWHHQTLRCALLTPLLLPFEYLWKNYLKFAAEHDNPIQCSIFCPQFFHFTFWPAAKLKIFGQFWFWDNFLSGYCKCNYCVHYGIFVTFARLGGDNLNEKSILLSIALIESLLKSGRQNTDAVIAESIPDPYPDFPSSLDCPLSHVESLWRAENLICDVLMWRQKCDSRGIGRIWHAAADV